jgi:hypothetical protein
LNLPGSILRRILTWSVVALCGACNVWSGNACADDLYPEDSVKAAFILRFASYVAWPEDIAPDHAFVIAVLGSSAMAESLQQQTANRSLMNRPIQVRRITSLQNAGDAQILYVGNDRRPELRELLTPLAGRSVLVITSEHRALDAGSTINLLVADHRVRLEVSMRVARPANLRISSELLSLAVRVQK